MKVTVFLSYPQPHMKKQVEFMKRLSSFLEKRGLEPRTLGVSDYDMEVPLRAIRRMLIESNGVLAIAFKRSYIEKGVIRKGSDLEDKNEGDMSGQWLTSPFCHIEPAMAYQLGLPVLIFREKGVIADGLMEKGVLGLYMPEFDLDKTVDEYLDSTEFLQIMSEWECQVRCHARNKGTPIQYFT